MGQGSAGSLFLASPMPLLSVTLSRLLLAGYFHYIVVEAICFAETI
jgi:hypothetical protein